MNAMLSQKFMMMQVIWCTFLSIVVPMLIAGSLRKEDGKRTLINLLTAVIQPIFLYYKLSSSKLIRYKILKQNDISLAIEFKDISAKIKVIEDQLVMHHRVQVGTETVFQLVGNVILVCYAYSQTKTTQGLAALFQHDSVDIISISISSKVVLGLLLVMNLVTYIWVHYGGIVKGYGANHNLIAKFLLILCIACCSFVRIMSITLYFTPTLGLFNLLRHYQGILKKSHLNRFGY